MVECLKEIHRAASSSRYFCEAKQWFMKVSSYYHEFLIRLEKLDIFH